VLECEAGLCWGALLCFLGLVCVTGLCLGMFLGCAGCGLSVRLTTPGTVAILALGANLGCCGYASLLRNKEQAFFKRGHCTVHHSRLLEMLRAFAKAMRFCGARGWATPRAASLHRGYVNDHRKRSLPGFGSGTSRWICFCSQFYRHSFFQRGKPCFW